MKIPYSQEGTREDRKVNRSSESNMILKIFSKPRWQGSTQEEHLTREGLSEEMIPKLRPMRHVKVKISECGLGVRGAPKQKKKVYAKS